MVIKYNMRGFSVPLSAFGLLSILTFAIPHPVGNNDYARMLTTMGEEVESSTQFAATKTPSLTRFNPIHKRNDDILGDGWSMQMIHSDIFFPVEIAAVQLIDFYRYVIEQVQSYSQSDPLGYRALALTRGQLALNWWCPQTEIPWSLIHTFAEQMLQATFLGYTGQFAMRFTHLQGIAIDVVLQVGPFAVEALGLAHGDRNSAGSSSGGTVAGSS